MTRSVTAIRQRRSSFRSVAVSRTLSGSAMATGTNWQRAGSRNNLSMRRSEAHHLLRKRSSESGLSDRPKTFRMYRRLARRASSMDSQFRISAGMAQKPQRVTAGRRVHHDAGVAAAFHPIDDLQEGHEFIEARQRQG